LDLPVGLLEQHLARRAVEALVGTVDQVDDLLVVVALEERAAFLERAGEGNLGGGLDIANHVGEELNLAPEGDNVLAGLVRQGKLGKKTGEGFYLWEEGKPKREQVAYDRAELERLGRELVQPMLDEAERALSDRVVASADHVDAGMVYGTGFAPFRGGPLHYRRNERAASAAS